MSCSGASQRAAASSAAIQPPIFQLKLPSCHSLPCNSTDGLRQLVPLQPQERHLHQRRFNVQRPQAHSREAAATAIRAQDCGTTSKSAAERPNSAAPSEQHSSQFAEHNDERDAIEASAGMSCSARLQKYHAIFL